MTIFERLAALLRRLCRVESIRRRHGRGPTLRLQETGVHGLLYGAQVRPFMIELPISHARSAYFPLPWHVFSVAASRAIGGREPYRAAIESTLDEYRSLVKFANGAERIGLDCVEVPALAATPPGVRLRPWTPVPPHVESAANFRTRINEGAAHGIRLDSPHRASLHSGGAEIVRMHADRLETLIRSIGSNGYRAFESGQPVIAEILVGEDFWCWHVMGGHHRTSVAYALGLAAIPVQVRRLVFRRDSRAWPNVRFGTFSEVVALKVFDNLLNGIPPAGAAAWIAACRKVPEPQN